MPERLIHALGVCLCLLSTYFFGTFFVATLAADRSASMLGLIRFFALAILGFVLLAARKPEEG